MIPIVQIVRAVDNPAPIFRTLGAVVLRRDEGGRLFYRVGNSALILCAQVAGCTKLLKCYTSASSYRQGIYGERLLLAELCVPSLFGEPNWVDVVVEDWVEGVTLKQYIERLVLSSDRAALRQLSARFDRLALELLSSESAHGDITCENIIVDSDGELHLIDFDASYLPLFEGCVSEGLGTEAYQHPARTADIFDRTIDDFPLALISTALSFIALDITALERFDVADGILFRPAEIVAGCSVALGEALSLFNTSGMFFAYVVACQLLSNLPALPELMSLMRLKVEGIHPQARPTNPVCIQGRWGYVNEFGRAVIPPIFAAAAPFSEGFAAVRIASQWHYINERAEVVLTPQNALALKSVRHGCGRVLTADGWIEVEL